MIVLLRLSGRNLNFLISLENSLKKKIYSLKDLILLTLFSRLEFSQVIYFNFIFHVDVKNAKKEISRLEKVRGTFFLSI